MDHEFEPMWPLTKRGKKHLRVTAVTATIECRHESVRFPGSGRPTDFRRMTAIPRPDVTLV
jgi:hypothetical protein